MKITIENENDKYIVVFESNNDRYIVEQGQISIENIFYFAKWLINHIQLEN
jgi:hypothetical protein